MNKPQSFHFLNSTVSQSPYIYNCTRQQMKAPRVMRSENMKISFIWFLKGHLTCLFRFDRVDCCTLASVLVDQKVHVVIRQRRNRKDLHV